jgi:hypothetical protein
MACRLQRKHALDVTVPVAGVGRPVGRDPAETRCTRVVVAASVTDAMISRGSAPPGYPGLQPKPDASLHITSTRSNTMPWITPAITKIATSTNNGRYLSRLR